MSKWKITTHRPSETHQDQNELIMPGHRMGWRKRREMDGKGIGYQAYCTCKWKDTEWVPMRMLQSRYHNEHFRKVKEQGVLC